MIYRLFLIKNEFKKILTANLIKFIEYQRHDEFFNNQYSYCFDYLTLEFIKDNLSKIESVDDLVMCEESISYKNIFMDDNDVLFKNGENIYLKVNDTSSFLKKTIVNNIKNIFFLEIE